MLRSVAQREFDQFAETIAVLHERLKDDCVAASHRDVHMAQGKAQAIGALRQKLEKCTEIYEEMRKRR
jgi:t-SNARE complex subunit (syntaxin)